MPRDVVRRSSYDSPTPFRFASNVLRSGIVESMASEAASSAGRAIKRQVREAIDNYLERPRKVPRNKTMAPIPRTYSRKQSYPKIAPCRPKVKVSKNFKNKVHAVESAKQAKGTYTVRIMGNILTCFQSNQQQASAELYYGNGVQITSTSSGNPAIANAFNWFTQGDMLDAASVLFNSKVSDVAASITTGNFNTETLVLQIPYASVTMKLRNNTMTVHEFDFYQCIPVISTTSSALADWQSAVAQESGNISAQNADWYGAEPGQTSTFGKKWKYTKKTFVLAPGKSVEHFVKQGPLCYTYSKYLNTTTNFNFPKGIGMSCFIVNRRPQLVPNTSGVAAHHSTSYTVANYSWVTCELVSKFVIEAPEISEDAQKFDKWATNTYVSNASTFCQTQVGAVGDTTKRVYSMAPEDGPVTVIN